MLGVAPLAARAQVQDDIDEPAPPVRAMPQGGASSASALNAALTRLGRDPRNVSALMDAGQAALRMGDTQAALGFYTRADQVSPGNARIKMQIGSALVMADEPVDAVRYFDAAESANGDLTSFALDRGLAYDLLGDNSQAQGWYQVALSRGPNAEATLRYAISLAISHDLRTAEAMLAPLVQKQDRAAWRARTFALAINGDETQAVSIARAMMPAQLAEGISPYLRYMPRLTRSQQAAAANLGRFPRAADIGHDDGKILAYAAAHPEVGRSLVPSGAPLGAVATAEDPRTSRAKRRRPGQEDADTQRTRSAEAESEFDARRTSGSKRDRDRGKQVATGVATVPSSTLALAPTARAVPAPLPTVAQRAATPPPTVPTPTIRSVLDGPPARSGVIRPNPALAVRQNATVQPGIVRTADPRRIASVAGSTTRTAPPPDMASASAAATAPVSSPRSLAAATLPATPQATRPAQAGALPGPSASVPSVAQTRPPTLAGTPATTAIAPVALPPSNTANASTLASRPGFDLAQLDSSRTTSAASLAAAVPPATSAPPTTLPAPTTPAAPAPQFALIPSAGSNVASPPPSTPSAGDFGATFGGFTAPEGERQTAVAAVDLSRIKPTRPRPARAAEIATAEEPPAAGLKGKTARQARLNARGARPDGPVASRSGDDEDDTPAPTTKACARGAKGRKCQIVAASDQPARAGAGGARGRHGAAANPSRIWVQLLTAPNHDALPREWTRLARAAPAQLRGKRGWVTPWGRNFRLLMGPYASDDDAQDALNDLTKARVHGFMWTSPAGQVVEHLEDGE